MILKITSIALFFILIFGCSEEKDTTNLIIVRHAEKNTATDQFNPKLTARGKKRARKLRTILDSMEINAIYSTTFDRNMQTVMPLAAHKGMDIQSYTKDHWKTLLDSIPSKHPSGNVLICSHSDIIFPMIRHLGIQTERDHLDEDEYDKIFIITDLQNSAELKVRTYSP